MKHIVFLLCICFSANVFSQVIRGKVCDENGVALAGANIVVENSMSAATSDLNGNFDIVTTKDEITLIITFLGYQDFKKTYSVTGNSIDIGEVRLESKVYINDEVIIQATRFENFNPTASSNISGQELQERATLKDITQILELQPSVVATSEAGTGMGATAFRIRGIDPTRINVTINGMVINEAESQAVFWNNMPDIVSSVSNLELTRGIGTSTNGSAAFGGNVNILTNKINNDAFAEIGFWAGSFNSFKEHIIAGTGLLKNGLSLDLRYSKLDSDGYIRNGYSDHSSLAINASWRNEKNLIKANILHGKQKTGITWNGVDENIYNNLLLPERYRRTYNADGMYFDENGDTCYYKDNSDNYKQTHYILSYSHSFNKKLNLNVAARYTRGDGYYEEYKLARKFSDIGLEDQIIDSIIIKKTDLIRQKWMGNNAYSANTSLNYYNKALRITGGADFNYYDGSHFGKILWMQYIDTTDFEWYRNQGDKMDGNVFAKVNYEIFKGFHLFVDLQYRYVNYKMKGIDDDLSNLILNKDFNFFNPKAGIFYYINSHHELYLSFANSHREPTRSNYKEANHFPDRTPNAETLFDYELGYNFKTAKFAGNINLYYMDYYDQLIPTGELSGSGYDIMRNVDRSYRTGIEISAIYKPIKQIEITGTATISSNKILNHTANFEAYDEDWNLITINKDFGNVNLAYSPNYLASGSFSYEAINNLFLRISTKYVGEQYFDNTQSDNRKIPSYWIQNFQIDYSFSVKKIVKEIQLKFQVNNFTNEKYYNDAIGGCWYEQGVEKQWAAYFPQAGINFMGGISIRF